ncbi:hypothetical protein [Streptomyces sp. B6B3]|uniref:hypothetical protein n=1 Tax=Streptomyces sp. B6B3 TaxID=3153570 RepID=UPI00325DA37D
MARGRHRNSALHRVLLPACLGGAALACAGATWLVGDLPGDGETLVLRGLAAGPALAAVVGAVLLRRWDIAAGLRVARERAAKASLNWRVEQRQAELENAQERLSGLEDKIAGKRADLEGLRTEHAALLRRYATAESERAKALEGRRQLALEAAAPTKALPARATDHRTSGGAPTRLTYTQAHEALNKLSRSLARQREAAEAADAEATAAAGDAVRGDTADEGAGRDQIGEAQSARPRSGPPPVQRTGGGFDFFGTKSPHRALQQAPRPQGARPQPPAPRPQATPPAPAPRPQAKEPERG